MSRRKAGIYGQKGGTMAKYFNTTGVCMPSEHYMVSLDGRLAEIRRMIDSSFVQFVLIGRRGFRQDFFGCSGRPEG